MLRTVCIDAMICIWGVKKEATQGQDHKIAMAEGLLDSLKKEGAIMVLPSPIVTEILSPVEPGKREELVKVIQRLFRIIPVDSLAAAKASELWYNNVDGWKDLYKNQGQEGIRNRFKFDLLIAATAITRKVDYFYTEDEALLKLCKGHIDAGPIPPLGVGPQLGLGLGLPAQ